MCFLEDAECADYLDAEKAGLQTSCVVVDQE